VWHSTWHHLYHCCPNHWSWDKCHLAIGCSTSRIFKFQFSHSFLAPSWRLEDYILIYSALQISLNEIIEVLHIFQPHFFELLFRLVYLVLPRILWRVGLTSLLFLSNSRALSSIEKHFLSCLELLLFCYQLSIYSRVQNSLPTMVLDVHHLVSRALVFKS